MAKNEPEVTKDIVEQIDEKLTADRKLSDEERGLLNRMVAKFKKQEYEKLKPIEDLVKRIEADGKITREEIEELGSAVMKDGELSSEEWMIIQGIVTRLTRGDLEEA